MNTAKWLQKPLHRKRSDLFTFFREWKRAIIKRSTESFHVRFLPSNVRVVYSQAKTQNVSIKSIGFPMHQNRNVSFRCSDGTVNIFKYYVYDLKSSPF